MQPSLAFQHSFAEPVLIESLLEFVESRWNWTQQVDSTGGLNRWITTRLQLVVGIEIKSQYIRTKKSFKNFDKSRVKSSIVSWWKLDSQFNRNELTWKMNELTQSLCGVNNS